jgi:hypothetical protein
MNFAHRSSLQVHARRLARQVAAWIAKKRAEGHHGSITARDVAMRFGLEMDLAAAALKEAEKGTSK